MAQKAAKQTARRNTTILNRTHLISLAINSLFILLRLLLFRASATRSTYLLYLTFTSPTLLIEYWLERIGRPSYGSSLGDLKKSGEDLEAKGLTEYLWDVLYWSLGCVGFAAVLGDGAWWLWGVVPLYSGWLGYTTFGGMRKGMAELGGAKGEDGASSSGGQAGSNRQKKMEKRGGQKMQYR
ncbi:MAG: hypothetical protein M1827_002606 [Pycnora praestabilis]|nr:MAG: hypothetical protein M1827_002606 [Pycnora praestabilis]